jgi:hypothetical protein
VREREYVSHAGVGVERAGLRYVDVATGAEPPESSAGKSGPPAEVDKPGRFRAAPFGRPRLAHSLPFRVARRRHLLWQLPERARQVRVAQCRRQAASQSGKPGDRLLSLSLRDQQLVVSIAAWLVAELRLSFVPDPPGLLSLLRLIIGDVTGGSESGK